MLSFLCVLYESCMNGHTHILVFQWSMPLHRLATTTTMGDWISFQVGIFHCLLEEEVNFKIASINKLENSTHYGKQIIEKPLNAKLWYFSMGMWYYSNEGYTQTRIFNYLKCWVTFKISLISNFGVCSLHMICCQLYMYVQLFLQIRFNILHIAFILVPIFMTPYHEK